MCSDMGHLTPQIILIELKDTVKNSIKIVLFSLWLLT